MITFIPYNLFAQTDYEKKISAFAKTISEKIAQAGIKRVAVSDFLDDNGKMCELGKDMAEEFSLNLINSSMGFEVMEKNEFNILKEQGLGKIKAVDAIIIGTISPFLNSYRISIKILSTETGFAIGGTLGNIEKTDSLDNLFNKKFISVNNSSLINSNLTSNEQCTPFTKDIFDKFKKVNVGIKNLKFFLSEPIIIFKNYGGFDPSKEIKMGKVIYTDTNYVHEIEISISTPCFVDSIQEDGLRIHFNENTNQFKFVNNKYSPIDFVFTGSNWKNGTCQIFFDKKNYTVKCKNCTAVSEVKLTIRKSDLEKLRIIP